jgi:ferredoxin hydrogenase large subunit
LQIAGGAAAGIIAAQSLTSCKKDERVEHVYTSMESPDITKYDKTFFVQVDQNKCKGCHTCTINCPTGIIDSKEPGGLHRVYSPDGCVNCGQCLVNCPYGQLKKRSHFINDVFDAIKDPDTIVVALPAPAVRMHR